MLFFTSILALSSNVTEAIGHMTPSRTVSILHFFHQEPYPILDYRALWSVSLEKQQLYGFNFWWLYVQFCRDLAERTHIHADVGQSLMALQLHG